MAEKKLDPKGNINPITRVDFAAEGLEYCPNQPYGQAGGVTLLADCFYPVSDKPLPVLVWIHGGGWSDPNLTRVYRPENYLAKLAKLGFFVMCIEYRLCPEYPFPAQIEDCKCAIRYLRANAEKLNIHPGKIGIWGESAGGHLVEMLGVAPDDPRLEGNGGWQDQSSAVQSVIAWYAPSDMVSLLKSRMKDVGTDEIHRLTGLPFSQSVDILSLCSPLLHVAPGKKFPPFLLMHGDMDGLVPFEESTRFLAALQKAGYPCELITVTDQGHGFFSGDSYYDACIDFLVKTLG